MFKWIFEVIFGNWCKHDYRFESETYEYASIDPDEESNELPTKIIKLYVCTKCGKFKKVKL